MILSFEQYQLTESIQRNKPLIVIDIQPEYEYVANKVINSELFKELINNQTNILWYFNGMEMVSDELSDVKNMLTNQGFNDSVIEKIQFKEKGFFFLRRWIDVSVPASITIKVLRAMVTTKVEYSDELKLLDHLTDKEIETLNRIFPRKIPAISIPDYISIKALKEMDGGYIIGGARSKCLKEITLVMNAFNIKYTMIDSLIF